MTMLSNTDLRLTINHLIHTCRDGQEGFLTAAENIGDDGVKKVLNELSLQRAKFTGELQAAAHSLGDSNPENVSSIMGTLHRGWMNVKTAVAGHDRHSILTECERGEDAAVLEYRKAISHDLPADLREIVERHFAEITKAHDRIKALRDGAAAPVSTDS